MAFWSVCLNRMPFATLIAFIICIVGLLMFSASSQRSAVLTNKMLAEVLAADGSRVLIVDIIFIAIELATAVAAIVILVIGILATGDTRTRVYSSFSARMSGQFCCIVLLVVTSILLLCWLLIFSLFSILFFVGVVSQSVCTLNEELTEKTCLHLADMRIFANFETKEIEVCGKTKIKAFCKDFVEKISPAYIVAGIGNLLVILGLIMFLVCLAANHARIRCEARYYDGDCIRVRDLCSQYQSRGDCCTMQPQCSASRDRF